MGLPYAKFYSWIKRSLIDFSTQENRLKLHEHDLVSSCNGLDKTVFVPIFRPELIDQHMAIDEKHINGQFYTVLSNAKTGKTAVLCSTIRPRELKLIFQKFGSSVLNKVKFITLDMAASFELVATENFPNAIQIVDKFHVIKNGIEGLQAIRICLKQEALKQQREEYQLYQKSYQEFKNSKFIGPKLMLKKKYTPIRLTNGETLPELLSRSRYLCIISPEKWTEWQQKRAEILFQIYPDLRSAFAAIKTFRQWYVAKDETFEPFENEKTLGNWIDQQEINPYQEIINFAHLVSNHEQRILNYHKTGHKTNAIAESINAKIMSSIRSNNGARDIDFFHTRLAMII